MGDAKNLSWRLAALGLALGAAAAAGVLALADGLAPPDAPRAPAAEEGHEGAMDPDARCAHMPEHCAAPPGGGA